MSLMLTFALLLVCVVCAAALKTSFVSRAQRTSTKLHLSPVLAPVLSGLAGVPAMYALFSMNEYVTHRWYQHNEIGKVGLYKTLRKANLMPRIDGGGHVEHHAETYDDMSLKTDDVAWMAAVPAQRLMADPWRGTAFTWSTSTIMVLQCLPTVYPTFMLGLGWSFLPTTAFFLASFILHGLVWNAIHPAMHMLPDVPMSVGFPSKVLKPFNDSWFFSYLRENHVGHHVASGLANYNVCCPGMDFVLGTAMKKSEWAPKVRAKKTREVVGALSADKM